MTIEEERDQAVAERDALWRDVQALRRENETLTLAVDDLRHVAVQIQDAGDRTASGHASHITAIAARASRAEADNARLTVELELKRILIEKHQADIATLDANNCRLTAERDYYKGRCYLAGIPDEDRLNREIDTIAERILAGDLTVLDDCGAKDASKNDLQAQTVCDHVMAEGFDRNVPAGCKLMVCEKCDVLEFIDNTGHSYGVIHDAPGAASARKEPFETDSVVVGAEGRTFPVEAIEAAIVAQHHAEAIEPGVPAPEPPSEIRIPVPE